MIEVRVEAGDQVAAGDTLLVVSAMKMETMIVAPQAGRVVEVAALAPGAALAAGEVVVTLDPAVGAGSDNGAGDTQPGAGGEETWGPVLDEVTELRRQRSSQVAL